MSKNKSLLFFKCIFVFIFFEQSIFAQDRKIDSMLSVVENLSKKKHTFSNDTMLLGLYVKIGWECDTKDDKKFALMSIDLADKLLAQTSDSKIRFKIEKQKEIAFWNIENFYNLKKDTLNEMSYKLKRLQVIQKIKDTANYRAIYYDVANTYGRRGNLLQNLSYLQLGLAKSTEIGYKTGIAFFTSAIGSLYSSNGDTAQALENFQKCLTIYKELKDTISVVDIFLTLGQFYSIKNQSKSLGYYQKALSFYQQKKDTSGIILTYSLMGHLYVINKGFDMALAYFNRCFLLVDTLKNQDIIASTLGSISNIYFLQKDFEKALTFRFRALKISLELNDVDGLEYDYYQLSEIYMKQKKYTKAKFYNDQALLLIEKYTWIGNVRNTEFQASQIDSILGNYKDAYFHYQKYISLLNKFNREDIRKAASKQKFMGELDKQKYLDKAENDKKEALAKEQLTQKETQRNYFIAGFGLVLILAGFIFRSYRQKQKANEIISHQKLLVEEKQKEILDSIHYAKRIQTSMMPTEKFISKNLNRLIKK